MGDDKYYVDPATTTDSTTLSNCREVAPKHVHLEWSIDFSAKTLSGSVTHTFESVEGIKTIDFDSSALKIERAYFNGKEVGVNLHAAGGSLSGRGYRPSPGRPWTPDLTARVRGGISTRNQSFW